MAEGELQRYRLLGLMLLVANLGAAFLVRTLSGSLRAMGGGLRGEAQILALVLAGISVVGTLITGVVLASCFFTFYTGRDRNPFVGTDFLPSWADLGLIVALLATCGLVVAAAR